MRCSTKFHAQQPAPLDVLFTAADCQNLQPMEGWTYMASLITTDLCGGFSEYTISVPPSKRDTFLGEFWQLHFDCDGAVPWFQS
jgi:hypothetical protein